MATGQLDDDPTGVSAALGVVATPSRGLPQGYAGRDGVARVEKLSISKRSELESLVSSSSSEATRATGLAGRAEFRRGPASPGKGGRVARCRNSADTLGVADDSPAGWKISSESRAGSYGGFTELGNFKGTATVRVPSLKGNST